MMEKTEKAIFGATDKRIECWTACKANKDYCKSCPFNGTCESEEYFPDIYDGIDTKGLYIPADYEMKGNVFC